MNDKAISGRTLMAIGLLIGFALGRFIVEFWLNDAFTVNWSRYFLVIWSQALALFVYRMAIGLTEKSYDES